MQGTEPNRNLTAASARIRGVRTLKVVIAPDSFKECLAAEAVADPTLDLGVHLTLTSEWHGYRWGPISTRSAASGLLDADGFFPRSVIALRAALVPEAAEAEMRAQIERAIDGLSVRVTNVETNVKELKEEIRSIRVTIFGGNGRRDADPGETDEGLPASETGHWEILLCGCWVSACGASGACRRPVGRSAGWS